MASLQGIKANGTYRTHGTYKSHGSYVPLVCYYFAPTGSPSAAILRISWVMRIEQNLGPHIEQNFADLKTSWGKVSSCIERAVSGSSESSNCLFQSNSKRARESSSSRWRAFLRPRAISPA